MVKAGKAVQMEHHSAAIIVHINHMLARDTTGKVRPTVARVSSRPFVYTKNIATIINKSIRVLTSDDVHLVYTRIKVSIIVSVSVHIQCIQGEFILQRRRAAKNLRVAVYDLNEKKQRKQLHT